jgi:hypothetical protein
MAELSEKTDAKPSEEQKLEISLAGSFQGSEISPKQLPFSELERFPKEVSQFVVGGNDASLGTTAVEIKDGSIRLAFTPPGNLRESLLGDLQTITDGEGRIHRFVDPERAKIINRWQRRAAMDQTLSYKIRINSISIQIDSTTNWKLAEDEQSTAVEIMLLGEVEDAGGESPNVHVVDSVTKERLIVTASRDQIRQESHPVYNKKLLHISAEKSLKTGKLNKIKLIRFIQYDPKIDETDFASMIKKGTALFREIRDAGEWVRKKRDLTDGD